MWVTAKPSGTRRTSGSRSRSSTPRQVILMRPWRSSLQAHPDATDGDLVPVAQRNRAVDAVPVYVRAVCAALVLDEPAPATKGEHRVVRAREFVLDIDRVVHVASHRVDRPQGDRPAGLWLSLRRVENGEPPKPGTRRDLRRLGVAQVAEHGAGEAEEDEVDEEEEADLEQQEQDPKDLSRHPRTWNSISVSPISIRSPGPSAISLTG